MRNVNFLDLAPYRRSTVGFDRLFDLMNANAQDPADSYPPFDIEKLDDGTFRVTLAVAGFRPEEIEIEAQQNLLTVIGKKAETSGDEKYVHRGIIVRSFERRFQIADFVLVEAATFDKGLLTIVLKREVPEAMKPRKVAITIASPTASSGTPEQVEA